MRHNLVSIFEKAEQAFQEAGSGATKNRHREREVFSMLLVRKPSEKSLEIREDFSDFQFLGSGVLSCSS